MMELTHISLFTGIGGIDLAAEWAGFETILMVENNAYCQEVLNKHWPNMPIIGDIKDATKEKIMAYAQSYREGRRQSENRQRHRIKQGSKSAEGSNKPNGYKPITLITGGFPCQPVSQAGKRRGKEDDRWLWPEMLRIIKDVRPIWVVAENVAGSLEWGSQIVYLTWRERVISPRHFLFQLAPSMPRTDEIGSSLWPTPSVEGNNNRKGISPNDGREFWAVEPDVGRVAHGIPSRVDRLKALGNAVVPQQIYPILKAIADIERGRA